MAGAFSCKAAIESMVNRPPEKQQDFQDNLEKQNIKVALLLDTSNSMDGLIDQAKAQLWEIVNEFSYAKCRKCVLIYK